MVCDIMTNNSQTFSRKRIWETIEEFLEVIVYHGVFKNQVKMESSHQKTGSTEMLLEELKEFNVTSKCKKLEMKSKRNYWKVDLVKSTLSTMIWESRFMIGWTKQLKTLLTLMWNKKLLNLFHPIYSFVSNILKKKANHQWEHHFNQKQIKWITCSKTLTLNFPEKRNYGHKRHLCEEILKLFLKLKLHTWIEKKGWQMSILVVWNKFITRRAKNIYNPAITTASLICTLLHLLSRL